MMDKHPPRPVKRLLSSWGDADGQAVASVSVEFTGSWTKDFLVIRFVSGDAIALRGNYCDYFGDLNAFACEPFTPENAYDDDGEALDYFGLRAGPK